MILKMRFPFSCALGLEVEDGFESKIPKEEMPMPRKKLPIGIQNFRQIREEGYCYVDKTPHILNLADIGKYFFLARPRRFGKSLLADTLRELFSCNESLFKGLFIHDRWEWDRPHPVLLLSLGQGVMNSQAALDERLGELLNWHARKQGITFDNTSIGGRFFELIEKLHTKHDAKTVVLVDEYDKPILDNLHDLETARKIREGLKNFYSVIKEADAYIRFAFFTGVSKFSKVSLFNGLNNLIDLTLDRRFATICGYTQTDLESVFREHLGDVDMDQLRQWYDGYHFLGENVYNPFDVLLFLDTKVYRNYWVETGTPAFLVNLIASRAYPVPKLDTLKVSEALLSSFDIDRIHIETLLYQTGYLTIQNVRRVGSIHQYTLRFPNLEVRSGFTDLILDYLVDNSPAKSETQLKLYELLQRDDIQGLRDLFHAFFAAIPHDWYRKNEMAGYEGYYAAIVYCYFVALGLDVAAEETTNHGRIDMTVRFEGRVYVLEFKVVELTEPGGALDAIKAKGYAEKFAGQPGWLVGIEFSKKDRNITRFEFEPLEPTRDPRKGARSPVNQK